MCFEKFEGVDAQFKAVLDLVQIAGFYEALSMSSKVFTAHVAEFYLNGSHAKGAIATKVKNVKLTYEVIEINHLFEFFNKGVTTFKVVDVKFPQEFEFLVGIIDKCILCKDSAHNSVSELQLKIMSAIVKGAAGKLWGSADGLDLQIIQRR